MIRSEKLASAASRQSARFFADESGATAIEYALIASGVGAFIAATVFQLGGGVKNLFTSIQTAFP
jgi:pilus assembly protein Flp/PilA